MMRGWGLAAAVIVVACGKSSEPASPGSGSSAAPVQADAAVPDASATVTAERCQAATAHAVSLDHAVYADAGVKDIDKLLADHCIKDQWDASVVSCLEAVKADGDVAGCLAKAPDAQKKALDDDVAARKPTPGEAPPEYDFTVNGFEIASIVRKGAVPTGFGKIAVTTYMATPKDDLVGNTMNIKAYELPAKWAKGKPDAVYAQQKADLVKQKLKFDKDEKVTVSGSLGHDVQLTGTQQDPQLGVALVRQRWFVHDSKLWVVAATAMSKQKDSAKLVAQGDRWVDSFAFVDKKKPPKGKK